MHIRCCSGCGRLDGEGLRILDISLCADCEADVVATEAHHRNYPYWVGVFHRIWNHLADDFGENR